MDCKTFREQIVHFQADEVEEPARERLQEHLNACADCARRLEFEDGLLQTLRRGLPRAAAPAGLESRIRAALTEQERAPGGIRGWYRRPWVAAAAAAAILALVVAPWFFDSPPENEGSRIHVVEQAVLVVDAECDRNGKTLAQQKGCRHPKHFNRLKLGDGEYWNVSLDDATGQGVVLAPDMRGQRLLVEGDLYPEIRTLHLRRFEVLDSARVLRRREQLAGLPLWATTLLASGR